MTKMAESKPLYDLAALAPQLLPGEALSSWLVRLADAHMITVAELQAAIDCPLTAFERGNLGGFDRTAAMTGLPALASDAIAPQDLLACPIPSGLPPPASWAVCPRCLQADLEAGRAPHARLIWQHPMATHCDVHRSPLVPHGNSPIKIASALTLWGEGEAPAESADALLEVATFDDPATLARVRKYLVGRTGGELPGLRLAVQDVVAALTVRLNGYNYSGSLMSLFEGPIFDRRSAPGALQIEREWWARVDAATRLLYVRVALFILSEPQDPATSGRKSPLGPNWLQSRYRHHKGAGWQAMFAHAAHDPLVLLATELPGKMVLQLGEMSLAWPEDLRRRWTYAAAVGALGGFVF
jgi:hypothetical protein